jgi:hypothetical protein
MSCDFNVGCGILASRTCLLCGDLLEHKVPEGEG